MLPDCPFWLAPELLDRSTPINMCTQTDVYALAVVLSEIFSGLAPFSSLGNRRNVVPFILEGGRPALPHTVPAQVKDILHLAWHHEPSLRCPASSLQALLQHVARGSISVESNAIEQSLSQDSSENHDSSTSLICSINNTSMPTLIPGRPSATQSIATSYTQRMPQEMQEFGPPVLHKCGSI